jgi:hypothetical protein
MTTSVYSQPSFGNVTSQQLPRVRPPRIQKKSAPKKSIFSKRVKDARKTGFGNQVLDKDDNPVGSPSPSPEPEEKKDKKRLLRSRLNIMG